MVFVSWLLGQKRRSLGKLGQADREYSISKIMAVWSEIIFSWHLVSFADFPLPDVELKPWVNVQTFPGFNIAANIWENLMVWLNSCISSL